MAGGSLEPGKGERPADLFKQLYRRGEGAMDEGSWKEAIDKLAKAVGIAREEGRIDWEIDCLRLIGETLRRKGKLEKADRYFAKAIRMAEKEGEKVGLAYARRGMGKLDMTRGDLGSAKENFGAFLEVAERIGVPPMIGRAYMDLARISAEEGDLGEAIEGYRRAIDLLGASEDHSELARTYSEMGDTFCKAGDFGSARTYYEKAMDHYSRYGSLHGWALAEISVAECCTKLGFVIRAMEHLESSREVLMRLKDDRGLGQLYRISGILMISQGNWSAAEAHLRKAVDLLERTDRPIELADTHLELARMYIRRGEMEKAGTALAPAREIAEKVGSNRLSDMVKELERERNGRG